MENSLKEKEDKLKSMLEKGMVMIHLDARKTGVRLPEHLKSQAHLTLNLSYHFSPADLTVNAWGVRATLSFERQPFAVAVPWSAIFALRSHVTMEFWLFPEDIPEEFLEAEAGGVVPPTPGKRAPFQLIHSAPPSTEAQGPSEREGEGLPEAQSASGEEGVCVEAGGLAEGEEGDAADKPKRPSHLRLLN